MAQHALQTGTHRFDGPAGAMEVLIDAPVEVLRAASP
jgi:hypothetical protein